MAQLSFKRYATTSSLNTAKINGSLQEGNVVFDAELKILYIVTIKLGNVELEPYYGTNTTYTFSGDGTNTIKIKPSNANEQSITINNVIQAANATNAENDSDGNKISSTYLKLTGGTVSGNLVVSGTSNIDDLQAAKLLISGQSKFLNEIEGTSKYSTHLGTNSNNYTYESLSTILAQKADKSSIPGSELITDRSKYADAIRTPDYRAILTSMNQTFSDSALHYFLANINYCTEGKPTFNSGVIHAAWSSSNYAAQLALPNDTNGNIQWRYEDRANNWSKWFNVIDDNNWFKYIGTTKNPVGNATNAALASKATSADSATSAITATTADKVSKSLKWGSKTYNGSSEQTITAADLGLSGAMHFLGVTTSNINEGSTLSSIIIDGKSVTQSKGDVVLYSHSEYIWTGSKWEELGSEQSFALKSVEISAGNGLTGGGTLEATRIISHADTSSQKSITTGGRTYINKIELDDFGHVTSLSTGTEADQIDISGNAATATRLRVNNVGSDEQPVYFKNGVPVTISKFTGTSSNSNYLNCIDTRNINDDPYVQKKQLRYELKSAYTVGISSGTYVGLLSLCPWDDSSGGYHYQVAFGNSGIQYRSGLNKWSDWNMFAVKSDIPTKLSQLTDDLGDAPSHTHKQYALKAGDTITGKYKFTAGLESDSITTEDLIVNGSAKFISGITSDSNIIAPTFTGNLKGNADTASSAAIAGKITEHTLWGQKFDGTSNVSGAISGITTISSTYLNTTASKATIKTVGDAILNIVGVSTNVDYQHIYVDGNGNNNRPLVLQNGHGNVGIGNSTPTYKLDVTGTARITGDTKLLGNVYASKFIGNLEGNAKSADSAAEASKATNDGSGNNITSTYITDVSTSGQNLVVTKNGNNTTVPINIWEANLQWGGKNFYNAYGPIDAVMIPELGANRFAFLRPEGITLEYSKDGGNTWTQETGDYYKRLFSTGTDFYVGQRGGSKSATANWKCRVTINVKLSRIYTVLHKFAIFCSTNGSLGCYGIFEAAKNSSPTIFETIINRFKLNGWSGWNIINGFNITTYGNSSNQYQYLRFTFGITTPHKDYNNLNIIKIQAFGGVGWITPSNMASTGHLYNYNEYQDAIFPAEVIATKLKGNLDWSYIQNKPSSYDTAWIEYE